MTVRGAASFLVRIALLRHRRSIASKAWFDKKQLTKRPTLLYLRHETRSLNEWGRHVTTSDISGSRWRVNCGHGLRMPHRGYRVAFRGHRGSAVVYGAGLSSRRRHQPVGRGARPVHGSGGVCPSRSDGRDNMRSRWTDSCFLLLSILPRCILGCLSASRPSLAQAQCGYDRRGRGRAANRPLTVGFDWRQAY